MPTRQRRSLRPSRHTITLATFSFLFVVMCLSCAWWSYRRQHFHLFFSLFSLVCVCVFLASPWWVCARPRVAVAGARWGQILLAARDTSVPKKRNTTEKRKGEKAEIRFKQKSDHRKKQQQKKECDKRTKKYQYNPPTHSTIYPSIYPSIHPSIHLHRMTFHKRDNESSILQKQID